MTRLKRLIIEVHRRSLWQVLVIYLGASWAVLEAVDHVVERYFLPEWVSGAAVILLLIGLPIVLATAFVREEGPGPASAPIAAGSAGSAAGPDPDTATEPPAEGRAAAAAAPAATAPTRDGAPIVRFLTWPRAILGGVLAFTALALVSAFIVVKGLPRVAEASGAAGDAFGERAWMVLAEFEAPDGEGEIADAAEAALVVDLQQSRYVNVYSRNQIAPVLRRMGLPDTTRLDEIRALEIAEREGLAAVLAAEISRLGSDYVLSGRVIQPDTRRDLIAVRTVARADRLAEGVESFSREVRRRLGETPEAVSQSKPLPEVTTRSLEALKKYAQAEAALETARDENRAIEFATQALRLDSTFAMAERLLGVAYNNQGRLEQAVEHISRAYELRHRLTDRERLQVEAFYHYLAIEPRRAADTYELILSQYPDDARAANNLGVTAGIFIGDAERAYQAYRRAIELNPYSVLQLDNLMSSAVTTGRWPTVDSLVVVAEGRGLEGLAREYRLRRAVAFEEWGRAEALCDSLLAEASGYRLAEFRMHCGSIDVARGRFRRGVGRLESAARYFGEEGQHWGATWSVGRLALAEDRRGRPAASTEAVQGLISRFPASSLGELDTFYRRANLALLFGVIGRLDLMDAIESAYPPPSDTSHWQARYATAMQGAARELNAGNAAQALELLREGTAGDYAPSYWESELILLRALAFEGVGEPDSAIAQLESAIAPARLGGLWRRSAIQMPVVLRRLAALEEDRGNPEAAARHYARLLELWSDADPAIRDQVTAVRRALSRLGGLETS